MKDESTDDTEQTVEFPERDYSLLLTPTDIEGMLNGEAAIWSAIVPGIKLKMTAEVVSGEDTDSDRLAEDDR